MKYDSTLDTLEHIKKVQKYIFSFCQMMLDRALVHDQSKFSENEKPYFDEETPKLKGLTYNTKEYHESLARLKPALDHHYSKNSHHPEHYPNGIEGFDALDLVEMLMDWKAASERHEDGCIHKSVEINIERFKIEPQLASIIRNTAKRLWPKPLKVEFTMPDKLVDLNVNPNPYVNPYVLDGPIPFTVTFTDPGFNHSIETAKPASERSSVASSEKERIEGEGLLEEDCFDDLDDDDLDVDIEAIVDAGLKRFYEKKKKQQEDELSKLASETPDYHEVVKSAGAKPNTSNGHDDYPAYGVFGNPRRKTLTFKGFDFNAFDQTELGWRSTLKQFGFIPAAFVIDCYIEDNEDVLSNSQMALLLFHKAQLVASKSKQYYNRALDIFDESLSLEENPLFKLFIKGNMSFLRGDYFAVESIIGEYKEIADKGDPNILILERMSKNIDMPYHKIFNW